MGDRVEGYAEADRRFRIGGNPILPPAEPPVIGWMNPMGQFGTAAHANTGSRNRTSDYTLYAGVVGYVSGTVVWALQWSPTAGGPTPTLTDLGSGIVRVNWPSASGNAFFPSLGMVLLTATLDGVPTATGQGIEAATVNSDYGTQAWAPET